MKHSTRSVCGSTEDTNGRRKYAWTHHVRVLHSTVDNYRLETEEKSPSVFSCLNIVFFTPISGTSTPLPLIPIHKLTLVRLYNKNLRRL